MPIDYQVMARVTVTGVDSAQLPVSVDVLRELLGAKDIDPLCYLIEDIHWSTFVGSGNTSVFSIQTLHDTSKVYIESATSTLRNFRHLNFIVDDSMPHAVYENGVAITTKQPNRHCYLLITAENTAGSSASYIAVLMKGLIIERGERFGR